MSQTTALAAAPHRTSVGAIVMLVIGALLTLIGSGLVPGGATAAAVAGSQGRSGFLTSRPALFAADSYAITTPHGAGISGPDRTARLPFDVGQVRLRAAGSRPVFLGIARQTDVDRYLAGVHHTEVTDLRYSPFDAQYRDVPGTRSPDIPGRQSFWVASASGSGRQEVTWTIQPGDWAVVLMNADGTSGISARVQAGFRSDLFAPIGLGILLGGIVLLLVGIPLLVLGAAGIGRSLLRRPDVSGPAGHPAHPVRLVGRRDPTLSRGLWIVKWLLAIPHYFVLVLLWAGFVVTTIVAGFAILFTGRYPRSLFAYNLAVLRWTWRVGFYAYSALGTDRYPPFTFGRPDYPADLEIAYPQRLSNGLVLVKWWLLAIPHYILLGALTGGGAGPPVDVALVPSLRLGHEHRDLGVGARCPGRHRRRDPPVHRPVPAGPVRPRGRHRPLGVPGGGVRGPDAGRVPAVPARPGPGRAGGCAGAARGAPGALRRHVIVVTSSGASPETDRPLRSTIESARSRRDRRHGARRLARWPWHPAVGMRTARRHTHRATVPRTELPPDGRRAARLAGERRDGAGSRIRGAEPTRGALRACVPPTARRIRAVPLRPWRARPGAAQSARRRARGQGILRQDLGVPRLPL